MHQGQVLVNMIVSAGFDVPFQLALWSVVFKLPQAESSQSKGEDCRRMRWGGNWHLCFDACQAFEQSRVTSPSSFHLRSVSN